MHGWQMETCTDMTGKHQDLFINGPFTLAPNGMQVNTRILSRKTDGAGSKTAARQMVTSGGKMSHEARIRACLGQVAPLSARIIAAGTGLTIEQVCRRLPYMSDTMVDGTIDGEQAWRLI